MLTELARQVALALHNVELDSALQKSLEELREKAEELQESRARIVAASDAARRQIERNLHDGAQQHLVALAVNVRLARKLAESDPEASLEILDQLGEGLQSAVQELRALAHGIYPPLLADRGIEEALRSVAGRHKLACTEVDAASDLARHTPEVEAAVISCCSPKRSKSAGKHAGADATVKIHVWEETGMLLFEVSDDGAGFDASNGSKGKGAGFVQHGRPGGGDGREPAGPLGTLGEGTSILGRIRPLTSRFAGGRSPELLVAGGRSRIEKSARRGSRLGAAPLRAGHRWRRRVWRQIPSSRMSGPKLSLWT